MILYWPDPSVIAVRTFSMSAGLAASTVTPGSTAPDASLTVPAIAPVPCADAMVGSSASHTAAATTRINVGIAPLLKNHTRRRIETARSQHQLCRRDRGVFRVFRPENRHSTVSIPIFRIAV